MKDQKIIIYDTRSLPEGMTVEDILEIYHATGVITYDSYTTGNLPYSIDVHNADETEIAIIKTTVHESNIKINRS